MSCSTAARSTRCSRSRSEPPIRHCEEQRDDAISPKHVQIGMRLLGFARNDSGTARDARRRTMAALRLAAIVALALTAVALHGSAFAAPLPVVVASKEDTEGALLGNMIAEA